MPSEFDLLRPLDDEPHTPSTVDVRRAIADGRRRRRIGRVAGYTSVAAVTALALVGASVAAAGRRGTDTTPDAAATGRPTASASGSAAKSQYTIPGTAGWTAPAATAPTSCSLTQLPVPDNVVMALVSGADPTGRYIVGRSYPKGGGYQAIIWHDGKAQKVMLPGDLEELLHDVNSTGTAVGWSYQGDNPVPYVYRNGKVSKLPGVKQGSAEAINGAGAIVGNDDSGGHALVWPSATANPIRLPLPAGSSPAKAVDIDEDGTVVGNIGTTQPYVWFADGKHHSLPLPTLNGTPAPSARVFSIRNGWASGVADVASPGKTPSSGANPKGQPSRGESQAVVWNVHTGEVRAVDGFQLAADGINAQGWQIGIDKPGRAVLVAGGAPVILPELAQHKPNTLSTIASTLSDDGQVIGGQSDDANDTIRAVVWHCK